MSDNPSDGVSVRDNRMFNPDGTLREDTAKDSSRAEERSEPSPPPGMTSEKPPRQTRPERDPAPGDIDFPTFILSLASSVQISMGLVPNPMTGGIETDLMHAKQTIDILGMLEEKTTGNLAPEESGLLKQILFQLRMQYVEISKSPR
jgi:hypothetical protein